MSKTVSIKKDHATTRLDSSHDSSSKENHNNSTMVEDNDDPEDADFRAPKRKDKGERKSVKKKKEKTKKEKKKSSRDGSGGSDQDDSDFDDSAESGSEDDDGFQYSEEDKDMIVRYFNKTKLEELQSLINSKKLETVIALRPFRSFTDLVFVYVLSINLFKRLHIRI